MVLKTFSVEEAVYMKFASFCRQNGINMSKQVENFMKIFIEDEPEAKTEYLEKLDRIRRGKFVHVDDFSKRYGL